MNASDFKHFDAKGHRQRMRQRLNITRIGEMSEQDLLEMLLFYSNPRQDTKPLAKNMLKNNSISSLLSMPHEELMRLDGVGEVTASLFRLVHEIGVNFAKAKLRNQPVLKTWHAVLDYCRTTMGHSKFEQLRVLYLDNKNRIIADELQQTGTVDETPIFPREVAKGALIHDASAVIMVHNHPSGDAKPSPADIIVTEQLKKTLMAVRVKLHDHIIISSTGHFSFKDQGIL
ncbi:MAG: DNA repair protein RadC [Pseudomonadota bacterium]